MNQPIHAAANKSGFVHVHKAGSMSWRIGKNLISFIVVLLLSFSVQAATITWNGSTSTNFSDSSNWTGGMPGSGDNVIIPNNPVAGRMPVLSSGSYSVSSITINAGATLTMSGGTLTLSSSLTVNGILVISEGQINQSGSATLNSGAVVNQSGGTYHFNSNPVSTPSDHLIINAGGTYNQTGGILEIKDLQMLASTAVFNQSGSSSIIRLDHDFKNIGGSFNSTGGTIEWTSSAGSGASYVNGTNQFHHVIIGSGDPKFDNDNNGNIYVSGNWTNNSNVATLLNQRITHVTFNGSADQIIGGAYPTPFYNMTINKPAGSVTLNTNCTLNKNGTLSIAAGTLNLQSYTMNAVTGGGSGVFSISNGGKIILGGTSGGQTGSNFPGLFTGMNIATGSTIEYNATATQTIYPGPFSYSNLILSNGSGSGSANKITTANLTVDGTLTVNANAVLTPAASNLIGGSGTLTGSGTVVTNRVAATADFISQYTISNKTLTDLTVDYSSSDIQFVNALNYGNLTISGSRGINSVTLPVTGTVGIAKVFNPIATFSVGNYIVVNSTVNFNGNIDQTVPAFTYNNLVCSGSGTVKSTNGTVNFLTAITVNSNVTLDLGTNVLGLGIATTNNGTIRTQNISSAPIPLGLTWTGSVEYNSPTGGQTVSNGTYSNVTINNALGSSTLAGNVTVTSNLNLTAGTLQAGAYTLTINGNISRASGAVNASAGTVLFNGSSAQNIAANSFTGGINNLTINNSNGVTLNSDQTITTTLNLMAGNLSISNSNFTISGTITRTTGAINAATGTVTFNGGTAQNIPANSFSGSINNLSINNANGVTVNSNHTISSALNLVNGNLDINGTTLTLGGTITGSGMLKGSNVSSLTVAASGTVGTVNLDQTNDGVTNALANLSVTSGSVALGNKLQLFSVLNISGGTLNMDGKNVVLKSNATNTARVAPVTGTINNATNVTVERFFPDDERRYRLIAPAVTTTGSIRDNWMEGAMNTCFWGGCNINPNPGYGTQITGAGGNANGFDVSQTSNSSLFSFNQSTGGWVAIANTNGILEAEKAYLIFIRGDRSVDMTLTGPPITLGGTGTTLRSTGSLKIGSQTYSSLASNGSFSVIANPYASPVSWSNIHGNNTGNFENYYTYWDAKVGVRGSFVTVTTSGLKSNPTSNATMEIQGGQSFFVKAKAGVTSPSLSLQEADKSTTSNINVFRSGNHSEKLYTSLFFIDPSNNRINADGVLSAFGNNYNAAVDGKDAQQITNWDEDISILRDGKSLSIETRPLVDDEDTIFLSIAKMKVQQYEWQFDASDFITSGIEAFVVDNYLKTTTPINLYSQTIIPFSITTDVASSAPNRFYIVLKINESLPAVLTLPVEFTALKAHQKGNEIGIEWKTVSELKTLAYQVERAGEQGQFVSLATISAQRGNSNNYHADDVAPLKGINYYRIKAIGESGAIKYSNVVTVNMGNDNKEIYIYPNPVKGSAFTIQLRNFNLGKYNLQLVNTSGFQLLSKDVDHEGGLGSYSIYTDQSIQPGLYKLVLSNGKSKWNVTLISE